MAFDDRELELADDGTFEFSYVAEPGAKTMIVREVFCDWDTEERGTLTIERPDTIDQPARPLTEALLREESLNEEQMLAATGLTRRQVKTNPIAASR